MGFKYAVAVHIAVGGKAHHELQMTAEAFVVAGFDGGTCQDAFRVIGQVAYMAVDGLVLQFVESREHSADGLFHFGFLCIGNGFLGHSVEGCQCCRCYQGNDRQREEHIGEGRLCFLCHDI